MIKGGTILNIVPKLCQFEFEIRHLAEDDPLEIIQRIKQYTEESLIKEMHNISSTTNIEINEKINYPGLNISESISPVKQVKELLGSSSHKKVIYGTEGGLFKRELNLPTIICGPGSIDQAHKPDEFISIQQIEKGGTFIDKLINNCSYN